MDRTFTGSIVFAACALLGLAAFQTPTPPQDPPKPAPAPAPAPKPDEPPQRLPLGAALRIAGFPGADKEKLAKQHEALKSWLSKELGRPVEIVPVDDVAAAMAGLLANKLELAWLDGVSAVRVGEASKSFCWPAFAREEDLKRKSYFIVNKKLVDAGTFTAQAERSPLPLEQLAALKPKFAELSFQFGAKSSIASHLMPRYFLERTEVGIDPEKNFKQPAGYALKDGDSGVLANVCSGATGVGVTAGSAWEQASDAQKAQAPVIFVTPEYMDSCMVLYNRVGPALSFRILSAFLKLDPKLEEQQAVLDLFGTKRFVRVGPPNLAGLAEVLKSARERKLLE